LVALKKEEEEEEDRRSSKLATRLRRKRLLWHADLACVATSIIEWRLKEVITHSRAVECQL
jgi:hypothetical protein